MFYYFDPLYFLFPIPGLLVALFAQAKVKSSFHKFSQIACRNGLTGAQAAQRILEANGISNVRVVRTNGNLTDHYDPRNNTIALSDGVYGSATISAIGVAAHEAGHAVQYAKNYAPIKWRSALVPVCNFGAGISPFLILLGYLMNMDILLFLALGVFGLSVLFQLVTLPVEFNASRRALQAIESYRLLDTDELQGAKSVLSAAALTYVAALLQSLLIFLYYFVRFSKRRD